MLAPVGPGIDMMLFKQRNQFFVENAIRHGHGGRIDIV